MAIGVGMHVQDPGDDSMNLAMSEAGRPLYNAVKSFITVEVEPLTEEFFHLGANRADRWSWAAGQLELLDSLKSKARQQGLWNFFLPCLLYTSPRPRDRG